VNLQTKSPPPDRGLALQDSRYDKPPVDHNELLIEEKEQPQAVEPVGLPNQDSPKIKEEEEDSNREDPPADTESDSSNDEVEIADSLIPVPDLSAPTRVLRDRTLHVKPAKYSHFTQDPKTFKKAVTSENAIGWTKEIDDKLEKIERHEVWEDQPVPPKRVLHSTWVFKTKPATASSPEKQKARLCIQGFLQTFGEDFFETFAPTGKFPSLLSLLVLAIDLQLPIRQFDVKSAFLFAPLDEEIYIKTPEGSKRSSPYLKLNKSLYGLKQAPKKCWPTPSQRPPRML
jgi:hypothetical protein